MIAPAAYISEQRDRHSAHLSIVMPVYNECAVLDRLTEEVVAATEKQCRSLEIVYVNDGSMDGSAENWINWRLRMNALSLFTLPGILVIRRPCMPGSNMQRVMPLF